MLDNQSRVNIRIEKVKAHQTVHDGMLPLERWLATGNDLADGHALRAERLFAKVPELNVMLSHAHTSRASIVIKLAVELLPLWPRDGKMERITKGAGTQSRVSQPDADIYPQKTLGAYTTQSGHNLADALRHHLWVPIAKGYYCP